MDTDIPVLPSWTMLLVSFASVFGTKQNSAYESETKRQPVRLPEVLDTVGIQ